ncbi:DNA glycosylase [Nitzschia inconspicua]|uniref:DNA glycosylase n=1 Tax=Nitzschia inconspicua TaxID=303405 RepID=A0A9K3LI03_9STRA|nr:DNA glycosylase [Nitzschia inconspicua]
MTIFSVYGKRKTSSPVKSPSHQALQLNTLPEYFNTIIVVIEGPGATRNADKARCFVGSTNEKGQVLTHVLSVGKEVFLVFEHDNQAIRLHFGMNGSLVSTPSNSNNKNNNRSKYRHNHQNLPTLELEFFSPEQQEQQQHKIVCYSTNVSTLTAHIAQSKFERLCRLDVCSDQHFDCQNVLQALRSRPAAMLTDVLLDQNRFPGVGNIIKVEGLHRAKLHPKRRVEDCSDDELGHVIQSCRSYAMKWYKSGTAPQKLVYNQTTCQTCHGMNVRIEKMGADLGRTTFWCDNCQPFRPNDRCSSSTTTPSSTENAKTGDLSVDGRLLHCPQHGTKSVRLRRVRKQASASLGRIFVSCAKCPAFFQWADRHLVCTNCKANRILRISKTSHSGGQWFLSCSSCKSFSWAQPADLKPIQSKLTPLL